eukprot:10891976-Prorocentrum_lima.AAC.1
MTSSLVGSEMCIRDRTLPVWGVPCELGVGLVSFLLPNSGTLFQPAPVSYTHLTLPTICSV